MPTSAPQPKISPALTWLVSVSLSQERSYRSVQLIGVTGARRFGMPFSLVREFCFDVMVGQIRDKNSLLTLAVSVLIKSHAKTIERRLGQLFRRIFIDRAYNRSATYATSLHIFSPKKFPLRGSGFSFHAAQVAALIT